MKKRFGMLLAVSLLLSLPLKANNLPPVAVLSSTPDRDWFYNGEDVVFDYYDSYDPDTYLTGTRWYINNVLQQSGTFIFSKCFVLHGSPVGDCYELPAGQTTVAIKLGVKDVQGAWDYETITYTIREHKGRKYFVKDHLGSVRATVNRDGNVLGYDDYYPFGLAMPGRSSNSANPNDDYKFTGHELDNEAGLNLMYAGARYSDPILGGRWLSIDPLAAKYPSLSPYAYVANNPINAVDPDGRYIWFVHGTFSDNTTWNERGFNALGAWENVLQDRIWGGLGVRQEEAFGNFNWSGGYSHYARRSAARRLAEQIAISHKYNPEELIQIVGHSHGGNVSIMAANILMEKYGIAVDRIVLLGTPYRRRSRLKDGAAKEVVNIYSEKDQVQLWGMFGLGIGAQGVGAEFTRQRPNGEGSVEINATIVGADGAIEAHTTLHNTQDIINFIEQALKEREDEND